MKHQKFSITPKSTKFLRNLSINFIWIGLWGPNVFTLRLGRKNWLLFLCFAVSEGMFSLFMLSFYRKTPLPLLHCYSALNPPFLAVIKISLTLESISIGSISYWDHLTQPTEVLLSGYSGDGWKWRSFSAPSRSDLQRTFPVNWFAFMYSAMLCFVLSWARLHCDGISTCWFLTQ